MVFSVKLLENDNIVFSGDYSGFLSDNCINYNDGVNNIFHLNTLVLERFCDDYKMVLDFFNLSCYYFVDGMSVNMTVDVIDKKICSNSLFFKYILVDTGIVYEYSIVW